MQRENNLIYKGLKVRPTTRFSTAKQMPEANGKKYIIWEEKTLTQKFHSVFLCEVNQMLTGCIKAVCYVLKNKKQNSELTLVELKMSLKLFKNLSSESL